MQRLIRAARECSHQLGSCIQSELVQRATAALVSLADLQQQLEQRVVRIRRVAPRFDLDESVAANGYRSLLGVHDRMVQRCIDTCGRLATYNWGRAATSRSARELVLDVEAWCQWTASLGVMFEHLETLADWSTDSLFPDDKHSPIELLKKAENIDQYCFYGRMMGFQFDANIRPVLQRISRFMCMYSHYFYNTGSSFRRWATASLFFRRIMNDPDYRAKRIVNISRYADIDFCKAFWSQQEGELVQMFPEVIGPSLAVNVTLGLPPEPLVLPCSDQRRGRSQVTVQPPSVHIGADSIYCRLLSTRRRAGMVGSRGTRSPLAEPSPYLVFHCHGGGFVAQSSKSHEVYLRQWAAELDAPIFSIDYSLAPGAPFPRACQEVFYAYCWALRHCRLLGSTAERVLVVGDSAGGNLVCSTTLTALRRRVRAPDAQLLIYTPFNVSFVPSPARLLCLMDPLLPIGFLMRCLHAYAGHTRREPTGNASEEDEDVDGAAVGDGDEEDGASTASSSSSTVSEPDAFGANAVYTLNPKRRRLGQQLANCHLDTLAAEPLDAEFQYFHVGAHWRLSPFLADDALLSRCPPTHVLSCHLDPCLDDCVSMAKRLRRLRVPVELTVLDGVCHGFLNFARFSEAAQRGSERCVSILAAMLRGENAANGTC